MAIYCFDIDGTIFRTSGSDYPNSRPIAERIAVVNQLFDDGHEITLFTARGTTTDRKSTRLNSSHVSESRMPSSA